MNKKYETPVMEVLHLENTNVLTVSGDSEDTGGGTGSGESDEF